MNQLAAGNIPTWSGRRSRSGRAGLQPGATLGRYEFRQLDPGAVKTLKALKTVVRQLRTEDDLTKPLKEVSDLHVDFRIEWVPPQDEPRPVPPVRKEAA